MLLPQEIDKPSLETAVQICESQDSYSINFHACALYLTTMVHKSPAAKQVNVAATTTKVDGVKLENRDSADNASSQSSIQELSTRCSHPSKRIVSGKTTRKAKSNGEDIPAAKKNADSAVQSRPSAWSLLLQFRNVRSVVSLPRTRKLLQPLLHQKLRSLTLTPLWEKRCQRP